MIEGELNFLDFLREARAGEGRGNEELLRAMLPLCEQVHKVHLDGKVAPLDGTGAIFADGGHLWFRSSDAIAPKSERKRVRELQRSTSDGVEVVARGELEIDMDKGTRKLTENVGHPGDDILRPVFLPGYTTWEQEVGHHDALTDIFSLGILFASLAVGADFTEQSELETFSHNRHRLTRLNGSLHPVLARAIVRMTEPNRHKRAQDLEGLIARLRRYRDVDERVDKELDFTQIKGFLQADRTSRRKIIQTQLQGRLFDITRRNRLIYFKATRQMLDLTLASVPTQLSVETIRAEELFLWDGEGGRELTAGRAIRLDKYLRFEDAPWIRGTLDKVRSEARRNKTEYGFSQLRMVVAFLNWHNLKEAEDERIRSPLLLLPVSLIAKRGVRNSYVLQATSQIAEVNPVLRHHIHDVYGLELPDQVDLAETDVETFHKVLQASIARSEPGVTLHLLTRPQIKLMREKARRRLDAWRRRSRATGKGLRSDMGVEYSYSKTNFQPMGLQLWLQKVKPEDLALEDHLRSAVPVNLGIRQETVSEDEAEADPDIRETEREIYSHAEAAAGPYDWAVDLTHCTLGNFNYRKMSLVRDYDRMLDEGEGQDHPSFDTLFSLEARDLANAPAAEDGEAFDLFTVVPADPTQAAAVRWGRAGRSFIIQGPPGTGKSQTITNLIADFAANGKKVLFVCQKRAALDVVYHRLAQHRLDQLSVLIHDSQGDKKGFIDDLKKTYTAWAGPEAALVASEVRREGVIKMLTEPIGTLARFAEGMSSPVKGGEASVIDVIGERLRQVESPKLEPMEAELVPAHRDWAAHRDAVHDAAKALTEVGESPIFSQLALRSVGSAILDEAAPVGALRQGLGVLEDLLGKVRDAGQRVSPDATSDELGQALALAVELRSLLPDRLGLLSRESARSLQLDQLLVKRKAASRTLVKVQEDTTFWRDPLPRADIAAALAQASGFDALFFLFRWLSPAWWRLRKVLNTRYDFTKHTVQPAWSAVLQTLTDQYDSEDAVAAVDQEGRDLLSFQGELEDFAKRVARLRSSEGRTPLQIDLVKRWSSSPDAVEAVLAAQRSIDALSAAASRVFDGGEALSFADLERQVSETRSAADLLPEVQGSLRRLLQASPEVRNAVRTLPLTPPQWDAAVSQLAIERTLRDNRPLARFDANSLAKRQSELSYGHGRLLSLNARTIRERVRKRFVERLSWSSLPHAQLNAEQKDVKKSYNAGRRILEREFEKVMRHRSIRELSEGDTGTVVYDLKPIWLMSPLSISDTIPLEEERFDVVIFDEASQIPLEEAIPAVYRAPQMIVVGDEMQLPPTSFFAASRSHDDTEFSDDLAREVHYDLDADSFLSHSARRLPSTMLGWHYRSRHEALIRFSNQAFYAGRLLTVPDRLRSEEREPITVENIAAGDTAGARVIDRPLSYHRLTSSPYSNRGNLGEAQYIARMVRNLLREGGGLTIGIVAFSEAQQTVIEGALNKLGRTDLAFQRELEAEYEREDDGQLVGLFVKNLENVQGDERDIIILSICYGPDIHDRMRMNFGPINKGGGEKRLNVVFSRAKRHMAVVASIDYTAITNQYNDGALCFRRYLQYAEAASRGDDVAAATVMRALSHDFGDPQAKTAEVGPVVDGLARALEAEGLVVLCNLGASEFRADLAVGRGEDSALSVAVLIDTAERYVDHDPMEQHHTRPSVLRAFGWTVVHVLSKDWLVNPEQCTARVVRALENPEAFAPLEPTPEPEPVLPPAPELEPVLPPIPEPLPEFEPVVAVEPTPGPDPIPEEIRPATPDEVDLLTMFAGTTFVVTGVLSLPRAEIEDMIRSRQGKVGRNVTRSTNYVLVGKRPGGKLAEAERRGVPLMDEATFTRIFDGEIPLP